MAAPATNALKAALTPSTEVLETIATAWRSLVTETRTSPLGRRALDVLVDKVRQYVQGEEAKADQHIAIRVASGRRLWKDMERPVLMSRVAVSSRTLLDELEGTSVDTLELGRAVHFLAARVDLNRDAGALALLDGVSVDVALRRDCAPQFRVELQDLANSTDAGAEAAACALRLLAATDSQLAAIGDAELAAQIATLQPAMTGHLFVDISPARQKTLMDALRVLRLARA